MKKKLGILFLVFVFLANFLMQYVYSSDSASSFDKKMGLGINVRNKGGPDDYDEEGTPIYRYFSGENIRFDVNMEISSNDVSLPYSTLKIWLPKDGNEYIKSVLFVDSILADSTDRSGDSDPEEFSITYHFNRLRGGMKGSYPVSLKFENMITPNGSRQPVYVGIFDQEGNLVFEKEIKIILEAKSYTAYKGEKFVSRYGLKSDSSIKYYDVSELPSNTSENLDETSVRFINRITPLPQEGARSQQGEFRAKKFKIVDTIPEGAVFLENSPINEGWVQDGSNPRVYTKEVSFTGEYIDVNIDLAFPNQPYTNGNTKNFVNSSSFYYYSGDDWVNINDDSASYKFTVMPFPRGTISFDKKADQVNTVINPNKNYENITIYNIKTDNTFDLIYPYQENNPGFKYSLRISEASQDALTETSGYHLLNEVLDKLEPIEDETNPPSFIDIYRTSPYASSNEQKMRYKYLKFNGIIENSLAEKFGSTKKEIEENLIVDVYKFRFKTYMEQANATYDKSTRVLVKKDVKIGELINVEDEGGYYNGISFVMRDKRNPDDVSGIRLRNVDLDFEMVYSPVKEGGKSYGENGEVVKVASEKESLLERFSDYLTSEDTSSSEYANSLIRIGMYSGLEVDNKIMIQEVRWDNNVMYIRPNGPKLSLRTSGDSTIQYSSTTSENIYRGSFTGVIDNNSALDGTYKVENLKGVVLLPPGVEYLKTTNMGDSIEPPVLINNYKSTGRTAIIYNFGDTDKKDIGNIEYELLMTLNANNGNNIVDTWLTWDNTRSVFASEGESNDILDLNYNNKTNDVIDHKSYNIEFLLPQEIETNKYISIDNKNWYLSSPYLDIGDDLYYKLHLINNYTKDITKLTIIDVLPGLGDKTIVENHNGEYLFRGRGNSGSEFKTPLFGPISPVGGNEVSDGANDKFDYYYSTAEIRQQNPEIVPDSSWIPESDTTSWNKDDWSRVTAFKAVLKQGKIIPALPVIDDTSSPEEIEEYNRQKENKVNEISIFTHNRVPFDTNLERFKESYNSIASKEGISEFFTEANYTVATNIKYTVSGTVFRDYLKNGNLDSTKDRLEGYKVELVYSDGPNKDQLVRLENGDTSPYVVRTDKDGNYKFEVYKRGSYKVRVTLNSATEGFTDMNSNVVTSMSNIDKNTEDVDSSSVKYAYTSSFDLNPYNILYVNGIADILSPSLHAVRNAGIVDNKRNIDIKKLGMINESKDNAIPLKGTKFRLQKDSSSTNPQNSNIPDRDEEKITDSNGIATFEDIPFGDYIITEIESSNGFRLYNQPVSVTVSEDGARINSSGVDKYTYDPESNIINVYNEAIRGTIKIIKSSTDNTRLSGAEFELYRDGIYRVNDQNGDPIKAISNSEGVAVFENIPLGDYKIKEVKYPEGHTSIKTDSNNDPDPYKDVTVTGRPENTPQENTVTVEISNRPVKATIKLRKVASKSNTQSEYKGLNGAVFGLYKKSLDGSYVKVGDSKQSGDLDGNSGYVLFDNVEYGTYRIKEEVAPKGYIKSDEEKEVRVYQDGRIYFLGNIENKLALTTLTPATKSLTVNKSWVGSVKEESIKVQLYKNGNPEGEAVELNESNGWTYKFRNLPVVDKITGDSTEKVNVYTVGEVGASGGFYTANGHRYASSISGSEKDGYTITNTHMPDKLVLTPATKSLTVNKSWVGSVKEESIKVQLYKNGNPEGEAVELNESNGWTYKFRNLPVVDRITGDSTEKVNVYTVGEVGASGGFYTANGHRYASSISGSEKDGYTITNTHMPDKLVLTPATKSLTVNKSWVGSVKEESIKVQLYKNGNPEGEAVELNESNGWTYKFSNLPVVDRITGDSTEKVNVYTVGEVGALNGFYKANGNKYSVTVSDNKKSGYTITNTYVPEYTSSVVPSKPTSEIKVPSKVTESRKPETKVENMKNNGKEPKTNGKMISVPNTGDSSNRIIYLIFAGSILVLAYFLLIKRKNK